MAGDKNETNYNRIIEHVFKERYKECDVVVKFNRDALEDASNKLGLPRIKNLGDIVYSYRFRKELPISITYTAPEDMEWIILGAGRAEYEFRLSRKSKISPRENMVKIKIPDATPEILKLYTSGTDEQALLARVRYNRLLDLFCGLTCYSIQSHLRTSLVEYGQIEIDEIYIGVGKNGAHYIIPCQAKSNKDKFGIVQVLQDMKYCSSKEEFKNAICRPMAFQFLSNSNEIAIIELVVKVDKDGIYNLQIVEEKQYILADKEDIDISEIIEYCSKEKPVKQ